MGMCSGAIGVGLGKLFLVCNGAVCFVCVPAYRGVWGDLQSFEDRILKEGVYQRAASCDDADTQVIVGVNTPIKRVGGPPVAGRFSCFRVVEHDVGLELCDGSMEQHGLVVLVDGKPVIVEEHVACLAH